MMTRVWLGMAVGCAWVLLTTTSRALADPPCGKCSGVDMFNPAVCTAGTDHIPTSQVELGLIFEPVCGEPDTTLVFSGGFTLSREAASGGVIDTEITEMILTAADGTTLIAGAGLGQGANLQPSLGTTTDNGDGTGHSTFNVYFEVETGGGTYAYNWDPLVVEAEISCIPPNETFTIAEPCLLMYAEAPMPGVRRPAQADSVVTYPEGRTDLPHDAYIPSEYAVLICGDTPHTAYEAYLGGWGAWSGAPGEDRESQVYDEFWNDINWLYNILIERASFTPDRIFVLWGDGQDWTVTHPDEVCCRYFPAHGPVTDWAATIGNVRMVLDGLKDGDPVHGIPQMTEEDSLYVYTFDHGDTLGGGGAQVGDSTLVLMDQNMTDVEFAGKLNSISYARRTVFMQQCFSGGFIDNLTVPPHNLKTSIYTACRGDECAYPADDVNPYPDAVENETCPVCGKTVYHGEFNYYFMSAHDCASPLGTRVCAETEPPLDKISSHEAGQWVIGHDSRSETTQFRDDGLVAHSWILTQCVECIPTLSKWGLTVMTLLMLTGGTIVVARRRRAAAA